jgi:hypothetical protein
VVVNNLLHRVILALKDILVGLDEIWVEVTRIKGSSEIPGRPFVAFPHILKRTQFNITNIVIAVNDLNFLLRCWLNKSSYLLILAP